jgi:hypothetical protein
MAKTVTVVNREDLAQHDTESVIARRLSGEPFGTRNTTIPLKDGARWATYEANSMADRNMHYRMVHELGWVPVRVEDLAPGLTPESIGWQVADGGQLVRGPQGDQRLYKMPVETRNRINEAKTRANLKGMGSAKAVKQAVTESASAQLGDEAASFVHDNITVTGSDRVGSL